MQASQHYGGSKSTQGYVWVLLWLPHSYHWPVLEMERPAMQASRTAL